MSNKSKKIRVEVVKPITLEDSFDIVLNKLASLEKDAAASDKNIYRAVADFADSVTTVAHNMVEIAITPDKEDSTSKVQISFSEELQQRFELLRVEADQLLLVAYSNEEIERTLKLEQLLERIKTRLQSIASEQKDNGDLRRLSISQLKEMAKARNLKAYSKLKKDDLIKLLSH